MARTSTCMKGLLAILGPALIGLMLVTGADAANPEPVTVGMDSVDPISITPVNQFPFRVLDLALNLETIIISTNDRASGSGPALILVRT